MPIRGIAFPFTKGVTGFPATKLDEDVIADNIRRILLTPKGSRPMRPSTGSDVYRFVFGNLNDALKAHLKHEIRQAIAEGEPRVNVLSVDVYEVRKETPSSPNADVEIVAEINYEVSGLRASTRVSLRP